MKSFLKYNDIEISKHSEGKSVYAERFVRTLKNEKIFKTSMYIDKLDNTVNKCNNTYHSAIKMKLVDVKSGTYIKSSKEIINKDHKFKIGDIIRISKYKKFFAKGYVPNCFEEVFVVKRI